MKTEFSNEREKHRFFCRMSDARKLSALGNMLTWAEHAVFPAALVNGGNAR